MEKFQKSSESKQKAKKVISLPWLASINTMMQTPYEGSWESSFVVITQVRISRYTHSLSLSLCLSLSQFCYCTLVLYSYSQHSSLPIRPYSCPLLITIVTGRTISTATATCRYISMLCLNKSSKKKDSTKLLIVR